MRSAVQIRPPWLAAAQMSGFFFAARGEMEIERTTLWINGNSIGLAAGFYTHSKFYRKIFIQTTLYICKMTYIFVWCIYQFINERNLLGIRYSFSFAGKLNTPQIMGRGILQLTLIHRISYSKFHPRKFQWAI